MRARGGPGLLLMGAGWSILAACGSDEPLGVAVSPADASLGGSAGMSGRGGSGGSGGLVVSDGSFADTDAVADATDAGSDATDSSAWDASGDADAMATLMPDFHLLDENPNSSLYQSSVSPRDFLGKVSAWYFGHST